MIKPWMFVPKKVVFGSNGSLLDLTCTAAELADGWSDEDQGTGESTAETNTPGVDPVATNWKLWAKEADTNDSANRTKDIGSIAGLGNRIVISLKIYCDALGTRVGNDFFYIILKRGDWRFQVEIASDGVFLRGTGGARTEVGSNINSQDAWEVWTFDITFPGGDVGAGVCDVYLGDVIKGAGEDCSMEEVNIDGEVSIVQKGNTTDNRLTYLDWLKIGDGFA